MFSIDGLVSGFDTSSIIESLLGFQQTQVNTFNARKAEITTEQTSFKGIEAQLLTLQSSLSRLNRATSSVFDATTASSSNEDIITAASDSSARSGKYQLTVEALATAEQLGSQGFESANETIGTGEITFQVGNRAATTITVSNQNNTLSGLVDAINDQSEDVNASIIFDQGAGQYRMLLTSEHTGLDNTISVTDTLDGGTGAIPDFSGDAVQEAQNAVIRLGSGPGAITATYDSNQIDSLIEDVTLNLNKADAGSTVTIEIAQDHTIAQEAIEGFVADFNNVIDFIDEQTRYDPVSEQASPLLGDRSVNTLKNRLLSIATGTIANPTSAKRLSQVGIDVNLQGKLEVNANRLSQALRGELDGIDGEDVRNLFGLNAASSNSGIQFLTGGTRTKASETPYEVDIIQAAEQAIITGTTALADSIVIDGNNNEFQITVGGKVSETLTLSQGTYTRDEFAQHVEATINASEDLGIQNVGVSISASNELIIRTEEYGLSASISSVSGTALATLGFTGTESDSGQDVAGTFTVNGVTETAKGTGRLLVGDSENENTADLQLLVTMTSDQVVAGVDGEVDVSIGASGQIAEYLSDLLDPENGLLKTTEENYNARIDSIDESIRRVEDITESKRESLIKEFTALESILSELQNTGSFIATQLATIQPISSNNNNNG